MRRGEVAADFRRPGHSPAGHQCQVRGHENRADDERVQEHSKRHGKAQFDHAPQRAGGHRTEGAGHDHAATGDDPAGAGDRLAKAVHKMILFKIKIKEY